MNESTNSTQTRKGQTGGSESPSVPGPSACPTITHSPPGPTVKVEGPRHSPVGVLLRNEEEGVMGGVTGGVRLPLLWRGGVDTFPRDTELDKVRESFG